MNRIHIPVLNAPELEQIDEAMGRAAEKARELSRQTQTPFVVCREGKVIDLNAIENAREAITKTASRAPAASVPRLMHSRAFDPAMNQGKKTDTPCDQHE